MLTRARKRDVFQIDSVGHFAGGARRKRRRRWPWAVGAVVAVVLAGLGYGYFAWPQGSLRSDPTALARIARPALASGVKVTARSSGGKAIPVTVHSDGTVWPSSPVVAGRQVVVEAVFRHPGWAGWLAGKQQRVELKVVAPVAVVRTRLLRVKEGAPVSVRFSQPVGEVHVGSSRVIRLAHPSRTVSLGRLGDAGSVVVSAVARSWEQLPAPTEVIWFPTGGPARLLVSPAASTIGLDRQIRLTASQPISALFHSHLPYLTPATPGSWKKVDPYTLVFTPKGYGYGLDAAVKVRLPAAVIPVLAHSRTRLLTWSTPTASELRLQQLLAQLGYLPVHWQPASTDAAKSQVAQVAAAAHPPAGQFTWRFADVPDQLRAQWRPGSENAVTRGAIMAFQSNHDLTVDGYSGRDFWGALLADVVAGKPAKDQSYSYVIVHRSSSPQSLTLWHDGQTVVSTVANTGIPKAPTALGTFPVYARFRTTTMSGTNPDGTHYHDPGVPWVSYFNGGDAIHGFNRASYGSAQSLGCVELPPSEAQKVWPYTPIGTLVTVAP
ncbi:MAG TPA: L,D-transpeptidase family protein [Gaiellaceae bacterium]|nr:L,D-transpeptidase family protein [Gaiellaceae bacterium]